MSNNNIFETEVHKNRGPRLRQVNFSTAEDEDTNGEAKGDDIPAKGDWKLDYKVDEEMTGEGFENVLAKVDRCIVTAIGMEKYRDLLLNAPCGPLKGISVLWIFKRVFLSLPYAPFFFSCSVSTYWYWLLSLCVP